MKESGLSTLKVLDGTKEKLDATEGVVSQARKQLKKMNSRMVKLRVIDYQPKEELKAKHVEQTFAFEELSIPSVPSY